MGLTTGGAQASYPAPHLRIVRLPNGTPHRAPVLLQPCYCLLKGQAAASVDHF